MSQAGPHSTVERPTEATAPHGGGAKSAVTPTPYTRRTPCPTGQKRWMDAHRARNGMNPGHPPTLPPPTPQTPHQTLCSDVPDCQEAAEAYGCWRPCSPARPSPAARPGPARPSGSARPGGLAARPVAGTAGGLAARLGWVPVGLEFNRGGIKITLDSTL